MKLLDFMPAGSFSVNATLCGLTCGGKILLKAKRWTLNYANKLGSIFFYLAPARFWRFWAPRVSNKTSISPLLKDKPMKVKMMATHSLAQVSTYDATCDYFHKPFISRPLLRLYLSLKCFFLCLTSNRSPKKWIHFQRGLKRKMFVFVVALGQKAFCSCCFYL